MMKQKFEDKKIASALLKKSVPTEAEITEALNLYDGYKKILSTFLLLLRKKSIKDSIKVNKVMKTVLQQENERCIEKWLKTSQTLTIGEHMQIMLEFIGVWKPLYGSIRYNETGKDRSVLESEYLSGRNHYETIKYIL